MTMMTMMTMMRRAMMAMTIMVKCLVAPVEPHLANLRCKSHRWSTGINPEKLNWSTGINPEQFLTLLKRTKRMIVQKTSDSDSLLARV